MTSRLPYLVAGITSRSSARVATSWDDEPDEISNVTIANNGLVIRVNDPQTLDKGRDHEITLGWEMLERAVADHRRDEIDALRQRIATLEAPR